MGSEEVDGVSVVDYAAYNEFGTSRIPARPFMQTTADKHKETVTKFTQYLIGQMIDGKISDTSVLQNLGAKYQSLMQMVVRDAKNWAVPNAESTIRQKGSSSPLINTGRMVGSIRYEVK